MKFASQEDLHPRLDAGPPGLIARAGAERAPKVSCEVSPPKTPEADSALWACIRKLEPLSPAFVSVTYGANGSTRDRTHNTVKRIVEETGLRSEERRVGKE